MPQSASRFSDRLWRLNAYIIAAAGLIAIVIGILALFEISKSMFRTRHVAALVPVVKNGDPNQTKNNTSTGLHIGSFRPIAGTTVLRAPAVTRDSRSMRLYSKVASGIANYVFYDITSGSSHNLLPDGRRLILKDLPVRPPRTASAAGMQQIAPSATLYSIVRSDTNKDGVLSPRDTTSLHIARPDGTALVQLADSIDEILGYHLVSKNELVVMLRATSSTGDETVKALHVSLDTFKILRETTVNN